jgi:hypothetical protein
MDCKIIDTKNGKTLEVTFDTKVQGYFNVYEIEKSINDFIENRYATYEVDGKEFTIPLAKLLTGYQVKTTDDKLLIDSIYNSNDK